MSDKPVGKFFDTLTGDYTRTIERCFPRYQEMLWALLDYLPPDRNFTSILELGCGTGNLSVITHERFPQASLRLVDLSEESLATCQTRLAAEPRVVVEQRDFRELDYNEETFDLVVSSISIHHLDAKEIAAPDSRRIDADVVLSRCIKTAAEELDAGIVEVGDGKTDDRGIATGDDEAVGDRAATVKLNDRYPGITRLRLAVDDYRVCDDR